MAWACTTCGACMASCPAFVNPVDEIIDLRRYQALTTGKMPKIGGRHAAQHGAPGQSLGHAARGPHGLGRRSGCARAGMPGEETDVLLFLGCASAFDDRNKKVARLLRAPATEGQASISPSWAWMRPAAARPPAAWDTNICSRSSPSRISRRFNADQIQAHRHPVPALLQHTQERVPADGRELPGTALHRVPGRAGPGPARRIAERRNGAERLPTMIRATWAATTRSSQPRAVVGPGRVDLVEMATPAGRTAVLWRRRRADVAGDRCRDAHQPPASERRPGGHGADVVATACPYCLLMFDDAIRSKGLGEQFQVLDISEILAARL